MSIFDHIYPKFCLGCGSLGTYCCKNCIGKIPKLQFFKCPECEKPAIDGVTHPKCHTKFGLDGLVSIYPYSGLVKKAIKQMKYRFAYRVVNDVLEHIRLDKIMPLQQIAGKKNVLVVPIPLYVSRLQYRGFNQAEVIARYVAKNLHIPLDRKSLSRIRKTQPQVDMKNREERLHNMKNVFEVKGAGKALANAAVLLVDDVYTTGATMRSATQVLKKNGIDVVWGLTIAQ